jgi:hypothetical protein
VATRTASAPRQEWHGSTDRARTQLLAYGFHQDLDLFSNFTYALDQVHGDQIEQRDTRWVSGLRASETWDTPLSGIGIQTTLGLELRNGGSRLGVRSGPHRPARDREPDRSPCSLRARLSDTHRAMKPDVRLCAHLSTVKPSSLRIDPADIVDWEDGPVTAIASCAECSQLAVLEMLDWSRSHRVRIFAVSGLEARSLATYRRNTDRGSCDPRRLEQETAALFASAGPVERIAAIDSEGDAVLGTATPRPEFCLPPSPWRERLPRAEDDSWFAELGLEKWD